MKFGENKRKDYGYKNVYPNVLMFSYAGSPYIDIRTDLNSFKLGR